MSERECQHCGASLEGRRSSAKFCGIPCKRKSRWEAIKSCPEKMAMQKISQAESVAKSKEMYLDKQREWRMRNADKIREKSAQYRKNNAQAIKSKSALYCRKNSDRKVKMAAEWALKNPDRARNLKNSSARDIRRKGVAKSDMQDFMSAIPAVLEWIKQAQEKAE